MKIFRNKDEIKNIPKTAVALGFFDGVHVGHAELISETVALAKEKGLMSAVFTFDEHPKNVMTHSDAVKRLVSAEDKLSLIEELGVDFCFVFSFADGFHEISPGKFAKEYISELFNAEDVFCGYNFHFGSRASGDGAMLTALGAEDGFNVHVHEPIMIDGQTVSSSLIRGLVNEGSMEEAEKFLGRRFYLTGNVIEGNKIGRTIGFPTANIDMNLTISEPAFGVYITFVIWRDRSYPAVTNLGIAESVGRGTLFVESHILDFSESIYGEEIRVEFGERIRGEEKFPDIMALVEQIGKDKETAIEWHRDNK
ncbi:MAG: bifunctional riboflavin kinase/FAD synthetase [Clostridiales Family XIII bacterium]|jgi:riboflavin kinase/FMN adenylyltransferase|nr:bifunctional riboflavin kinase/FAD synthetase [Clostridiales Family XIII bacterium]